MSAIVPTRLEYLEYILTEICWESLQVQLGLFFSLKLTSRFLFCCPFQQTLQINHCFLLNVYLHLLQLLIGLVLTAWIKSLEECEFLSNELFSVSVFVSDNKLIFFNLKLLFLDGNGAYDEVTSELIFSGSSCCRSPLLRYHYPLS